MDLFRQRRHRRRGPCYQNGRFPPLLATLEGLLGRGLGSGVFYLLIHSSLNNVNKVN